MPYSAPLHTPERVAEFHRVFGHPIAKDFSVPEAKTRLLRFKLLFEEVMEFGRAVGVVGLSDRSQEEFEAALKETLQEFAVDDKYYDLVEAADALADIDYVTQGTCIAFGVPAELVGEEVHNSNMSKLDEEGTPVYGPGGRVMKGPNYRPPDIRGVLLRHATWMGWNSTLLTP